jgi:hypothetical protein
MSVLARNAIPQTGSLQSGAPLGSIRNRNRPAKQVRS